jgi:hypothetical protein
VYFRNVRIEYGNGSYTLVGMFGIRRTFTAAQAKVLVTITSLRTAGVVGNSPQLLVIDERGAKILRLRGQTWDVEQFTELANDLIAHGVANDAIRQPITPDTLRDRFPKAISWFEAHPIAWGLLLGVGIVVVITLMVVTLVANQL